MRPGFPGRVESASQSAKSDTAPVMHRRRTFTATFVALLRRVARAMVAVKLRARTTRPLFPTRRALAVIWRAEWRTRAVPFISAVIRARAIEALRLRSATFIATIRPPSHHRRTTTLFVAARATLKPRTKILTTATRAIKTALGEILRPRTA